MNVICTERGKSLGYGGQKSNQNKTKFKKYNDKTSQQQNSV